MYNLFSTYKLHVAFAAFCLSLTMLPAFAQTAYERTVQTRDSSVSIKLATLPSSSPSSSLPQLMVMVPNAKINYDVEGIFRQFIYTASLSGFPGNATPSHPSCLTDVNEVSGLVVKICGAPINNTNQFSEWVNTAKGDLEGSASYLAGTVSDAIQNLGVTALCASPALSGENPSVLMTIQLGGEPNGPPVDDRDAVIQKLSGCANGSPVN